MGYQEGGSSSQLSGTVRGSGNCTEYGRWYGLQDMWCAMFVSWCANVAGISTSVVPKHAYTPTGLNWFKNKGQAYSRATVAAGGYTPQPGDIIYFKSPRNSNPTNHIGIVTSYSGGTVYTVEGNTSSATVSTNGGAVAAKSYSISNTYIVYICRPAYSAHSYENIGTTFYARIYNAEYGKYVGIDDNGEPYADVEKNDQSQIWKFERMSNDNFYKITNEKNGLLLDLQGGSTELGTNIITYQDVGSDAQRWGFISGDGGYLISSKASPSTAMDIDTGGQTGIAAWDCVGTVNRLFEIQEVTDIYELSAGTPSNLGEAFYARIHNTEYDKYLGVQESDDDVFVYSQSEKAPELWKFTLNSDASYKITNAITGKNLNLVDGNSAIGNSIVTSEEAKTNAQKWYIVSKNGGYVLQCKAAVNNALDISVTDNTDITNQTETGEVNQVFQIEKYAKYTVNHYIQNWGDYASSTGENEYTLDDSYYAESISGASVTPSLNEYRGFITPSSKTVVPADDGSTVINYYYSFRFGDANDDASIDANDLTVLRRRLMNNKAGDEFTERQADINGDGKVSLEDFLRLKLYLADNSTPLGSVVGGVNLGNNFNARIGYPAGDNLNLSLLGDNVITYGSSTAAAQIWNFIRQSDGSYKIVNSKNGKCLNVDGGVAADGTNVSIADDNGSDAQRWYIYVLEEGYCLVPVCAEDFRLDVAGASTSPETNVQIWSTNGQSAQLFTIDKIVDESEDNNDTSNDEAGIAKLDLGDNFNAKINYPAANGLNLSLLGDNVITYNDSSAPAQVWNFIRQSNGSYKIVNSKNGKCLNVDGGVATDGTNVSIAADDGSNAQRWYICASGSNYCLVPACATGSRLDVQSGSTSAEARLQIWSANSNAAQVFNITKIADGTAS